MSLILQNWASIRQNDLDDSNVTPGASVEIRKKSDNSKALIYNSNDLLDPLTNPFFADQLGQVDFWIAPGEYNIKITSVGEINAIEGDRDFLVTYPSSWVVDMLLADVKAINSISIDSVFSISDRARGKFKAVDSASLTANEIDIIETATTGIFLQYQPDKNINLAGLGS